MNGIGIQRKASNRQELKTPGTIGKLMFWYDMGDARTMYSDDGSTAITNGDGCYRIDDKSGNGLHLKNSASAQRPVWDSGDGFLDFDGSGDHLSTNDGDNSGDAQSDRGTQFSTCALTIFMVLKPDDWDGSDNSDVTTDGGDDYILGAQANNHCLLRFDTKDQWGLKLCDTSSSADTLNIAHNHNFLVGDGTVVVTIRVNSSGEGFVYKNTSAGAATDTVNNTAKKLHWGTLGSSGAIGAANSYNGKIFEVFAYDTDIDPFGTQAGKVYEYLRTKYAAIL